MQKNQVKRTALITGISGMDGSHMADLLLTMGYSVYGLSRNATGSNTEHFENRINLLDVDIKDTSLVRKIVSDVRPDEIYNFASQSSVALGWKNPVETSNTNATGVINILEAIRSVDLKIKFFQASSCEMFGNDKLGPMQNETTPFWPRSPYAISKLYAYWITKNYREAYDMFCCCGILYSHESERRDKKFVSRKITSEVAKIHLGLSDGFTLGNIDISRDWGYAPDYMLAIWKMLQQDLKDIKSQKAGDFIIASGETKTIREFLTEAFGIIGISDWSKYVSHDSRFLRPQDSLSLCGDITKAKNILGWQPSTSFHEMVKKMVTNDIMLLRGENE